MLVRVRCRAAQSQPPVDGANGSCRDPATDNRYAVGHSPNWSRITATVVIAFFATGRTRRLHEQVIPAEMRPEAAGYFRVGPSLHQALLRHCLGVSESSGCGRRRLSSPLRRVFDGRMMSFCLLWGGGWTLSPLFRVCGRGEKSR